MNYLKYCKIILNMKINKHIQTKYIRIPSTQKSVLIRNYGELYLSYFFDELWIKIDKFMIQDKKILLKIISKLTQKNKKIYLIEEVKVFDDSDIKYLFTLSKNIFIYQRYVDKTKELGSNQILISDISSYRLVIDKLDYFEKICNKYCNNDFDKILFTIVEISDYVTYGTSNTHSTSCIENALLLKYGVCIDFSIAIWKCLERLNIECLIIKGIGNENNVSNKLILFNHAWNQVKLDNKWYNVDVTWLITMNETKYLLANDEVFYKNGRHKTRFETQTCLDSKNNEEIIKKIEKIRKYKNIFDEYDNGNKEIKMILKK